MNPWQAIISFLAALWEALKPYMPTAAGFVGGMEYQSGKDAKKALKDVGKAADASGSVDSMSDADVLRYLQSVGSVRNVESEQANSKPNG